MSDNEIRRFELAGINDIKIYLRSVWQAGERYSQVYENSSVGKRQRGYGYFRGLPERAGRSGNIS